MKTRDELLLKVRQVLTETFELDPALVVPEAHLYEDLDLDSLDAIDLAVKLGSETGIKLKEAEMKSIRTVSDIIEVVQAYLDPASTGR